MACNSPWRYVYPSCHNLRRSSNIFGVTLLRSPECTVGRRSYTTEKERSRNADLDEKRKKFKELEENYKKLLCLDKLSSTEQTIHFLHAEAVDKGHFTYDDPFSNEKVLTRLRHFLKGKCCGKSCRHCIYEHISVVDEKKKALARFNSSYWVYEAEEDVVEFDEQHVVTYGRGPYPRKYAQNAPVNMITINNKPK